MHLASAPFAAHASNPVHLERRVDRRRRVRDAVRSEWQRGGVLADRNRRKRVWPCGGAQPDGWNVDRRDLHGQQRPYFGPVQFRLFDGSVPFRRVGHAFFPDACARPTGDLPCEHHCRAGRRRQPQPAPGHRWQQRRQHPDRAPLPGAAEPERRGFQRQPHRRRRFVQHNRRECALLASHPRPGPDWNDHVDDYPERAERKVVRGFVGVDTLNLATASGDELTDVPCSYRVG